MLATVFVQAPDVGYPYQAAEVEPAVDEIERQLAAAVGVRRILQDPLSSLKINIDGCDNVLSACAESGRISVARE